MVTFFYFVLFAFGAIHSGTQWVLLALSSEITHGSLRGHIECQGIELGSATFKASAPLTVLSLQPPMSAIFYSGIGKSIGTILGEEYVFSFRRVHFLVYLSFSNESLLEEGVANYEKIKVRGVTLLLTECWNHGVGRKLGV